MNDRELNAAVAKAIGLGGGQSSVVSQVNWFAPGTAGRSYDFATDVRDAIEAAETFGLFHTFDCSLCGGSDGYEVRAEIYCGPDGSDFEEMSENESPARAIAMAIVRVEALIADGRVSAQGEWK